MDNVIYRNKITENINLLTAILQNVFDNYDLSCNFMASILEKKLSESS